MLDAEDQPCVPSKELSSKLNGEENRQLSKSHYKRAPLLE